MSDKPAESWNWPRAFATVSGDVAVGTIILAILFLFGRCAELIK